MESIIVSSKGQLVIPEHVRKRHKIDKGTKLILLEEGNKLTLQKVEVIEKMLKKLKSSEGKKEDLGLLALAEANLKDIWDNEEDDKVWREYL
ncbi:MAG: AbrB/MazE/SpoVT family DNA-binding domain-containing protein [Candidatus Woesearchaeota archaeon]